MIHYRNHRRIIRKILLVILVFTFTCCNLYFKKSPSSNNDKRASDTPTTTKTFVDDNRGGDERSSKQQSNVAALDPPERNLFFVFFQSRRLEEAADDSEDESEKQSGQTTIQTPVSNVTHSKGTGGGLLGGQEPLLELLPAKTDCISPAYMEFPPDLFSDRARARGAIIIHIAVVCYMFYCLAVVCDHYFLPSLEECAQRLNLSQDVAGATFMAAGSSAPELFTAILGVFIAKGDVGTGTIVGSAVFNILFVIGLCSLYTDETKLNWWPVARDSSYYTFTVLLLIMCIYDGQVTVYESAILLIFYAVYILIMKYNIWLRDIILEQWRLRFPAKPVDELNNLKDNTVQKVQYSSFRENDFDDFGGSYGGASGGVRGGSFGASNGRPSDARNPFVVRVPETTLFEAANQVIIKYKRLFRAKTRFRSAAHLVIIRSRKAKQKPSDLPRTYSMESRKMSKIGPDDSFFWRTIPDPNREGIFVCAKWALQAPLFAALFYTIPDCKSKKNMFLATFLVSIVWTALFSYVMVWMVTMIGFTFGIPDSIMGITFLAAGTSVPDAYASIHVAKMGQADMAVSNSIGSNVFDILVGLALPWFVETAIVEPGTVSSINSGGLFYAVILLFLSLVATIYLFHRNQWTLNPHLGYSLLGTYVAFLILSSAIEFNLFGKVNPHICGEW